MSRQKTDELLLTLDAHCVAYMNVSLKISLIKALKMKCTLSCGETRNNIKTTTWRSNPPTHKPALCYLGHPTLSMLIHVGYSYSVLNKMLCHSVNVPFILLFPPLYRDCLMVQ